MKIKDIIPIEIPETVESDFLNGDTITIETGNVVIIDTTNLTRRGAICTTVANSSLVKGIAKQTIPVGKIGSIVISGITTAKVKTGATAVAIGDGLSTSATKGKLGLATSHPIAIALEAVPVNSDVNIQVDVRGM